MFGIGGSEILMIMIIALIFIGPKRLPALGAELGKFFRSYRGIKDDIQDQIRQVQSGNFVEKEKGSDSKKAGEDEPHS